MPRFAADASTNPSRESSACAASNRCERTEQRSEVEAEADGLFAKCRNWSTSEFESLRILGEGAFGIVHLVKCHSDGKHYALKQMEKARFPQKNRHRAFLERDALAEARSCWIVELHATFQDEKFVYMLTEFLPGGDLLFHLEKRGRLTATETAFYCAELLEALSVVHRCGFAHRDVKPDNIVLGPTGHLKLLDFGLAKHVSEPGREARLTAPGVGLLAERAAAGLSRADGCSGLQSQLPPGSEKVRLNTVCGTLEYMAPEVYTGDGGVELDIWSAGIIAFECLVGKRPFVTGRREGKEAFEHMKEQMLCHQEVLVERFKKTRAMGFTDAVSEQFLARVICPKEVRLPIERCTKEPFFTGLKRLHLAEPPLKPEVSSRDDASNFGDFGVRALPWAEPAQASSVRSEWTAYDFDREEYELKRPRDDLDPVFLTRSRESAPRSREDAPGGAAPASPISPKASPAISNVRRAFGGA